MNKPTHLSPTLWVVRAGRKAAYLSHFLSEGLVAIGWGKGGPIGPNDSDEDLRQRFEEAYPEAKPGTRASWVAQVRRFVREVEVGDSVVTYDPETRLYHVGQVGTDVTVSTRDVDDSDRHEYVRKVKWEGTVSRDDLSTATRNSLGSISTLFKPSDNASAEMLGLLDGEGKPSPSVEGTGPQSDETDSSQILQEYIDKSDEFIADQIAKLDWEQLQELVAGIIRAMGYRTRVSNPGPDRGVDVFASPDGLGLEEPRIFIEVKHREGTVGAQGIRSFLGGRRDGDRCLYVSTGGFSKEARYEAERSQIPLTLIAMPELRELLVDYYESLDSVIRALVPLRKVYWPVQPDSGDIV